MTTGRTYPKRTDLVFTPAPEGLHYAVCCDFQHLGVVQTNFGEKEKIRYYWELDEINPETGKRFTVSQMYTDSLHEKALVRAHLETWRGKKFTEEELKEFYYEKVVGMACQVQVIHNIKDGGGVWANVASVVPAPRGAPPLGISKDYVPVAERERQQGVTNPQVSDQDEEQGFPDDDIPFAWLLPLFIAAGSGAIVL